MSAATIYSAVMRQDWRWEIGPMENQEKCLSTSQLMDYLAISHSSIYRLMAKGMPNIMFGSVHRFPRDQVVGSLENQSVNKLNSREKPLAET